MSEIIVPVSANAGTGDLIEHLRAHLGRTWFASPDLIRRAMKTDRAPPHAVRVQFHEKHANLVKFTFITPDHIKVQTVFQLEILAVKGREYIDDWLDLIRSAIESKRAERAGYEASKVMPRNPVRDQVMEAMGDRGADADKVVEQIDRWAEEFVGEEKLA
jgi:hypothetical protein